MNKRNLVMQAAVAGVFAVTIGSANAATAVSATSVKFAAEQFLGTTPNAAIYLPNLSVVTATAIPAGSILSVAVELTGAIFATTLIGDVGAGVAASTAVAPAVSTAITCSAGSTLSGTTVALPGVSTQTTTTNNANVVLCSFTTSGAVGIGGTLLTLNAPALSAAGLASTSATVSAVGTIYVGTATAPVGAALPTAGTLEAASPSTTVATSANGVTITAAAGTAGKIDLTATPVGSAFSGAASATVVDLGTITVTSGTAKYLSTAVSYAIGTPAKTLTTTVTAPAGFFSAMKTAGLISLITSDCITGATTLATSTAFGTSALAAAATTVSTTAATPVTATAYHVCMSIPTSSSTSVALVPGTAALTATLGAAATQDSAKTLASTNLWALAYNGSQYDVRNYVPKGATGYTSFVRVINTGSVSSSISVAVIDETTGAAGTAFVLGTLAAGAAKNYSSTDVEAVTGAITSTARPRLRITGPTNTLNVQTFLALPSGDIVDMTGAQ